MYNYCFLPRTTTVDGHFAVNHYRRPEDVGFVKYLSETNVYNYFLYDRCENDYFLYIIPNPNRSEMHASQV